MAKISKVPWPRPPLILPCARTVYFEGVCVNYRNPDPRRGEPRVGSAPDVAFPVDPLDPDQNSVRLSNAVFIMFLVFFAGIGDLFLAVNLKKHK